MIHISSSIITNSKTKVCPTCSAVIPIDAKECPECGEKFDVSINEPEPSGLNDKEEAAEAEDGHGVPAVDADSSSNGIVGAGILLMLVGFILGPLILSIYAMGGPNILNINYTASPISLWTLFALGTIVGFIGVGILIVGLRGSRFVNEITRKED